MEFQELLSKLKQSNISKDADKTKSRVRSLWKAAGKPIRETVLSLAGVKTVTLQRTYLGGNISAKMALALAKTLNVSPYYLTGQSDETGTFSDAVMVGLLRELKYDKLLAEAGLGEPRKRGRRKSAHTAAVKPTTDAVPDTVSEAPPAAVEPLPPEETAGAPAIMETPVLADILTEDEAVLLLKAALLKAKAGGNSAEIARRIKALLLD